MAKTQRTSHCYQSGTLIAIGAGLGATVGGLIGDGPGVSTPAVVDSQAAGLSWLRASARASAGVLSPSESCGRSWL
jgi:hypothetical protein